MALSTVVCTIFHAESQTVDVGLLHGKKVSNVLLSPTGGSYVLLSGKDTVYRFRSDDAVSFQPLADGVLVKSVYGMTDTLKEAIVEGNGTDPTFKIRPDTDQKEHIYFDRLTVRSDDKHLQLVNTVDVEKYVGRVLMTEVGHNAADEFYKIQSIICRTYAALNHKRHVAEGFQLCDHEHCQVYSGLKKTSNEVVMATAATSGLVMLSTENELVLSAFHANCGGQTANSADVWKEQKSYLTSVPDTFCISERSAKWELNMDVSEFLAQIGSSTSADSINGFRFLQTERQTELKLGSESLNVNDLRRALRLRSTFFDLNIGNGKVHFDGRGYGHGVGLCQQGAMKMTEYGYNYSQILGYYYKGVSLVPITSLESDQK